MPRGNWEKLCLNQAPHPPPPLSTPNSLQETPPISPPPHYRVLSTPPPPKEKRRHRKHRPPRLENNCAPVVESSVCDNFNLILILVVWADNLFVYFWKGERGKGNGERGKGKIERPPHKQAICSTENQMKNVGETCQTGKTGNISRDSIMTIAIGIS